MGGRLGNFWIKLTVSVIMIHLSQHINGVRIKHQIGAVDHSKGIQLMAKDALPKYELGSIRSVETVYAVCTAYSILQRYPVAIRTASIGSTAI